ncbi:MAG: chromate efflux transporter, partial [Burkholderiaceae bacterium]|nr:chromate efflux transporter [Burkholderiaceae bacterium]
WLKLGFISFGGPAGQIAMMHVELVERRRWISEKRFLHALNYCMVLPGPEATQLAIYIGWLMHKTRGGIAAGLLFILPSLAILIGLSWIYLVYGKLPLVAAILYGIKPAVVAIVLAACKRIASRALHNRWLMLLALAALIALAVFDLPFPAVVLGAAVVGWLGGRIAPNKFRLGASHQGAQASYGPAIIDDDTPPPAHARFSWPRLIIGVTSGIAIGAGLWLALALSLGMNSPLVQLGLFFSKAALLTFGGAYAVLPYVVQGAVEQAHWLTPAQMMDGLALGETTPGPLIMIVTYVGFLGGWQSAAGAPLLPAIAGAVVTTFFTFLPSFVFVLAGGPLVEATREDMHFTAPLTAITAAVVGVIASLALFFARHVFRLDAGVAHWDYAAMLICAAALMGMLRFRLDTIKTLFACAAAGLVVSYLM